MKIVGSIDFTEVVQTYRRDNAADGTFEGNSYQDGEQNLRRAADLPGHWSRVLLSRSDILTITLPWHLSEGGGLELVPRTGLTVGQTVTLLRSNWSIWAAANPACTKKLEILATALPTPLFLSTSPVDHSDYTDLVVREGLFHVDGLHRALAWELAGSLPADERIASFVAGDAEAIVRQRGPK